MNGDKTFKKVLVAMFLFVFVDMLAFFSCGMCCRVWERERELVGERLFLKMLDTNRGWLQKLS